MNKINKHKVLEVLAWSAFVITLSGIMGIFSAPPEFNQVNAVQASDHSDCQYPYRTTNPADGCDNSDPCDPQDAAKGGSGECKDIPAPEVEKLAPVTVPESKPLMQCPGGK